MNGTGSERLSQENKRNQAPVDSILEEAESVAQGVLESIQKVAGTTACKGVQITHLGEWSTDEGNVNTYHSQSPHFNGSKSN